MFIEINQLNSYWDNKTDNSIYYITGPVLINTEQIRCVSITNWREEEKGKSIPESLKYRVYFDKDRDITTDIESYNKIKKYVITNNDIINE